MTTQHWQSQLNRLQSHLDKITGLLSELRNLEPPPPKAPRPPFPVDHIDTYILARTATGTRVRTTDLYANYAAWCAAEGHEPLSSRWFFRHLSHPRYKTNGTTWLLGIQLC